MGRLTDDKLKKIVIGKKNGGPDNDKPLTLDPRGMFRHTAIIGQSGSGKSFALGRLVEEIILQTNGKLLIFDLNSDFTKIDQVNKNIFRKTKQCYFAPSYEPDTKDGFEKIWENETKDNIKTFQSTPEAIANLFISWDTLSEKNLRQLSGLSPEQYPEAIWLIRQLQNYSDQYNWKLEHWQTLCSLMVRWTRKKMDTTINGIRFDEKIARFISISVSVETAQLVSTALMDAIEYGIWNAGPEQSIFDKTFPIDDYTQQVPITTLPRISCINLDSLQNNLARLFVVRITLERLWSLAIQSRWDIIHNSADDQRTPLFVVVDEAHRLAPNRPDSIGGKSVLELLLRIAAEGRKYGLFLILATQRPSKLNDDILSECDNVCVMRMLSVIDIDRIKENFSYIDGEKLKSVSDFKTGKALFSGDWINYATKITPRIAAQRTKSGGSNLPKDIFFKNSS